MAAMRSAARGPRNCFLMAGLRGCFFSGIACVSNSSAPVTGTALGVGHSYDAHHVGVVEVNKREREAPKHEAAGSVQVSRMALRCIRNVADRFGCDSTKLCRDTWAPVAIPEDCLPEILPRLRVKLELLTAHQGTLRRVPGAPARLGSSWPCRSESHPPGV